METILAYLIIVNVLGYLIMHIDKINAQKGKKRFSEASILTLAAIGGSLGVLGGMYLRRHKTKKKKFKYGLPLILVLQVLLLFLYVR